VAEVDIQEVLAVQKSISDHFRDGRPLSRLIDDLLSGAVHPLRDDFLMLQVAAANGRYYTFDHRRLWCMYKAGFTRVRVALNGGPSAVEQLVFRGKLGLHVGHLVVRAAFLRHFQVHMQCLSRGWHYSGGFHSTLHVCGGSCDPYSTLDSCYRLSCNVRRDSLQRVVGNICAHN
jgi:hypothetical protein